MVDSDTRFNRIAAISAFAAAAIVGAILYALYPNPPTYSGSSDTGYLDGTNGPSSTGNSQYDTTGAGNSSSTSSNMPPAGNKGPGY